MESIESSNCQQSNCFTMLVESLVQKYTKLWWDTSLEYKAIDQKYSTGQQKKNELKCDQLIDSIFKILEQNHSNYHNVSPLEKIQPLLINFLKDVFEIEDISLDSSIIKGFTQSTKDFIDNAKKFNGQIHLEDLFQALRNVWIMNSIQYMLDTEIEVTPSVFAYSMLYPYSDNYLDNPDIDKKTKEEFNKRFRYALQTTGVSAENDIERDIFSLVSMIEKQYQRDKFPQVFDSLLAIHEGQCKSINMQGIVSCPYQSDILSVTFEKGGTSVLADGYLVKDNLRDNQIDFLFGYGVVLQLIDDLRDTTTDLDNGHMTVFSQICKGWKLDVLTNRITNIIDKIMKIDIEDNRPELENLWNMIKYSCYFLVFESVAYNQSFYSKEYVKMIEENCPIRLSYFFKLTNKIKKRYNKMLKSGMNLFQLVEKI